MKGLTLEDFILTQKEFLVHMVPNFRYNAILEIIS